MKPKYYISIVVAVCCLSNITRAQIPADSLKKPPTKVISYEEYKREQEAKIQNSNAARSTTIEITDSIVTIPNRTDLPVISNTTTGLKEYPVVDRYDDALLNELYNNDMFDYMYDDVAAMDFSTTVGQVMVTDSLKSRLEKINQTTPFNIEYNPVLEKLINKKLSYQRVYLERLMTLSDYYFPMFEQVLDQYDIPLEMKYLAVVESALDARAKSGVGATGLWQFMFATGRNYNLEVNSYVDERMDPVKATHAACKYLKSLYNIYGDWDLALAAYNSGPGNVNKAIRRSGGHRNYWNIRPYLPRETAGYVPAFQVMMYLFTYASQHGFQPRQTPYKMIATDTVQVKKMIALEHVAQFIDEDLEALEFHNPSYKLDIIPVVDGRQYYLRMPTRSIAKFVSNESTIYAFAKAEFDKREKPLPELLKAQSRVVYKVKQGDYLGKIAQKYGVRISQIKRWNSLRNNNLKIGQRLYIHPRKPVANTAVKATPNTYTVKQGDSLWKIAHTYGISIAAIKKLNPVQAQDLQPGAVLKLK